MMRFLVLLLLSVAALGTGVLRAQEVSSPVGAVPVTEPAAGRFIFAGVSACAYSGSLSGAYKAFTPALHLGLRLNRKKRFNGSFLATLGSITGSALNYGFNPDPKYSGSKPVSSFRTVFFTLNYELALNLIKKRNFCFYVSQGIGVMRFEPYDADGNKLYDLPQTRAGGETFNKITTVFPSSLGLYGLLPNGYGFGLQAGFMNTSTDYLDNLSTLSGRANGDNVAFYRFSLMVPVRSRQGEPAK